MSTTIADSIALNILNQNVIITGVGNELHLYTSSCRFPQVLPVTLSGKVHGIELQIDNETSKMLVYGEKEFMLLECDSKHINFKVLHRAKLTDWISTAKFLMNSNEFVLLTAHSVLLRLVYDADAPPAEGGSGKACKLLEKCSSSDKSTLYCSHLHEASWNELVVFAGNAFGELLIWQPSQLSVVNGKSQAPVQQRVQLHNGVIFSIDYNAAAQLLTTTSDDRSIRFWQVAKSVTEETVDWARAELKNLASGYGHTARVFQGRIIKHDNEHFVVTVGEDSYFCIWRCNGVLMHKQRVHFGAVIWNLQYDAATQTLFTVGSTGNLLAYNLRDVLEGGEDKLRVLPQKCGEEHVVKIKFLSKDMLLAVTNKSRLIFKPNSQAAWQNVPTDNTAELFKCTVLEVYNNFIAMCGFKRVRLLSFNAEAATFTQLCDCEVLPGIIRAFHFLQDGRYLVSGEQGDCMLLTGEDLLLRHAIELPKCKERWTTAALALDDDLLLLSNRQGNLLLYKFDKSCEKYTLAHSLHQPHGRLGATQLQLVKSTHGKVFVRSAGHDGALSLLCIDRSSATMALHTRELVSVAWVERLLDAATNDELLLGFNDNHFVVWSKAKDFTLQVPCGGGHRCWHYFIQRDDCGASWIYIVFIKSQQILLHTCKLFNTPKLSVQLPPRNMWHTKNCNAMALLEGVHNEMVLVSVGDDNLLKISTHDALKANVSLVQRAEVHTHISNIRALKVCGLNNDSCLIISGGGRAQLCITKLHLHDFHVEQILNYTLKASTTQSTDGYSFDPETRIMACDVLLTQENSALEIYAACSDGFVRKLLVSDNFTKVSLEVELWCGRCVLQLRLVADTYVVVGTTDGTLRFYDLSLNATGFSVDHHASGVNALDISYMPSTQELHLLSGGDDQSVAYTQLCLASKPPAIIKSLRLKSQHTAQVTAASLRQLGTELYAFTAGVDQTLCKFNLSTEQLAGTFRTCIADIKGLAMGGEELCLLYGCGLQMYDFSLS